MFLQQFPGGLYSVHFQQGQHFPAQTGFIQHWNYLYVQLTKVKFGLISSDIALLSFPPCYFRLKTFRAASISNEFHGRYQIHYSWHEYLFSRAPLCHQLHLYFFFISIHNDGARKWEPCWLIWFFCKHLWPNTLFLRISISSEAIFLFVCMVWTF